MEFPIQSLRLTQLWRLRFGPMLTLLPRLQGQPPPPLFAAEFFEAVGWLAEGVFCGYFDPHEANVVLVLIAPLKEFCGSPETPLVGSLMATIWGVEWSRDPFRQSLQMTDGRQKRFELPLFGYALLLGDRFFTDRLASISTRCIRTFDEERWSSAKLEWPSIKASDVDEKLNNPEQAIVDLPSLSAGYIRLLEHMDASRSFFEHARLQSRDEKDFESYAQRIGGLNGWRVPLDDGRLASRFHDLAELFEFTIRPALKKQIPDTDWSAFADPFAHRLRTIVTAWESYHLSRSLATA